MSSLPPGVHGAADAAFAPVVDRFAAVLAEQRGAGASCAVFAGGRPVVDVWGGGRRDGTAFDGATLVMPYSAGKVLVAVAALTLVAAGRAALDDPVQRYWPEFRAPATLRQVLAHRAGVVAIDAPQPTSTFADWGRCCALLADQVPAWPPGTACGESALWYGHLVGEVIRRVDGRPFGRYLRDEVAGPLGLDWCVGLGPAELARTADLVGFDGPDAPDCASYGPALTNPPGVCDPAVVNSRWWRQAEVPAVNGHGTAMALARCYQALCDARALPRELCDEVARPQGGGVDRVVGGDEPWGLGVRIDPFGYGMGGLGGSWAGAERDGAYTLAFVTTRMGDHARADALEAALRAALS